MTRGDTGPRARDVAVLLIAFALGGAVLELAGLAYLRHGEGRFLFVGRQVLWMVPAFHLTVLGATGLAVFGLARLVPRLRSWWLVAFLGAAYAFGPALLVFHPRLHLGAVALLAVGLGVVAARAVRTNPARAVARARPLAGVLLAAAGVAAVWPALQARLAESGALASLPPAPAGKPNVMLIVLDVVRADHLSVYGYERPTTPALERFATGGVVFDRAIAPSPWTLPSHASALTGRWPNELSADWQAPLDEAHPTLAETMAEAGYQTGGFVGNTRFLSYETGIDRGFSRYVDYVPSAGATIAATAVGRYLNYNRRLRGLVGSEWKLGRRTAGDVRRAFEAWLEARVDGRPFFAFLNFLDAHNPYTPPPSHAGRFGGPAGGESLRQRVQLFLHPRPAFQTDSAGADRMIRSYDESIAYMDAELERLFEGLERRGLLDETVVIVTSDHGEHFGEKDLFDHGNSLYFPLLHVPLVIAYGDRIPAGARIGGPVSLRDLPATVIELAGVAPAANLPGRSLAPLWRDSGGATAAASPALAMVTGLADKAPHLPISRGDMAALVADSLLLILNGDGVPELYDVADDPAMRRNLVSEPAGADASRDLLETLRALMPGKATLVRAGPRGSGRSPR